MDERKPARIYVDVEIIVRVECIVRGEVDKYGTFHASQYDIGEPPEPPEITEQDIVDKLCDDAGFGQAPNARYVNNLGDDVGDARVIAIKHKNDKVYSLEVEE